ncbi:MAG: XRE family transcriptional regulator [Sodalinema sp.]|uniref:XRE family transcriptional regulator n=1 Tax=Sodalinema sp. TaxID=3080550 RepID=UPI0011FC30DC|nr:MAG: ImmA/IrrE family metallo-endopeptidase [Phormidium sp. SL48-SHIP]
MTTKIPNHINLRELGERLRQCRKQRGLTQADAARDINVARTTLVAIEKGERQIKPKELIQLARLYERPVSDFMASPSMTQPFAVQFRAAFRRTSEDDTQIQAIIQKFEQLCQNYLELEQLMESPLPQNYPPEYVEYENLNSSIDTIAESIAGRERQRLGLGDGPVLALRDILEQSVGIRVFYLKMPAKFSEIYQYQEQLGGCMAINLNHYEERRRWSMAHGYLHFLAHRRKPVIDYDNQWERVPRSEQLAEAFPKYFLMPTSGLLQRFNDIARSQGKFTPTNLFTLAHYYGVSIQALVYRLQDMKLLPYGTWEQLRDRGLKVKQVQRELGLEDLAYRADTVPIHYQHLAIEALDQGMITEGRFSDLLNVNRLEARRIAESLRNYSSGLEHESAHLDLRQV